MVEGDTHKSKNDYCNVEEGIQPTRCCIASTNNNNVHDNCCILPSSCTLSDITSKRSTAAVEYKSGAVNAAYVTDDRNSNNNNNNNNDGNITTTKTTTTTTTITTTNNNNNNINNNTDLEKGEKVATFVTINGTTTTVSATTASHHHDEGGNNTNNNSNSNTNTNNNNNNSIRTGFEQSIELCGYGRFHYVLLGICGLVSTSEEMDVISMSFILPSAQCDLDLNTTAKGWLNSVIFVGMMVGAYFWGSIADSVGRKKVLIVISFMNGVCIVASSFSQTYEWFMLFRFLNGAALGGSGPVIWSYFAEFQPKAKRGSMLSFMASFWTFGNLFVAGLAWLIIPTNVGVRTTYFVYNSWRIFLMVCSVPSFIVAFLLLYLPESPKYLLSKGKHDKALAIFRGIFVTNTKRPADQYPVGQLEIDEKTLQELHATGSGGKKGQERSGHGRRRSRLNKMMSGIVDHGRQLFSAPILKFTLVSIVINFTFHIGYYGLMMWFPELFNRFEKYHVDNPDGERDVGVCTVIEHVSRLAVPSATPDDVCISHIPSNVFMESLISLSSALPANLIAILAMDRLGRKFFLIFGTLTAGLCSAGMYFVSNATQNLVVTAIFSGAISAANAALDCLITEVFPTHLRATGVAISMVAARLGGIIGNIVIATLLDRYCPAPTVIVATLLIGGGLMCLLLPNTTRRELN